MSAAAEALQYQLALPTESPPTLEAQGLASGIRGPIRRMSLWLAASRSFPVLAPPRGVYPSYW